MRKITRITPLFAVTGALHPEDLVAAAGLGFNAVISNLPDGEAGAPMSSGEEARLATKAGLGFWHIPAVRHEVFSERVVDGMQQALSELEGPVLAHCASGIRSALAWGAAAARYQSADCVLETLRRAGFDLSPVREELEDQRDLPRREPIPPPLDCDCA
jgi:sulfide:quinone oxidoreductase